MSKVLFYAFTPFQVITALSIKMCYFSKDDVDLVIDDSVLERNNIKNNISKNGIFEKVFFTNRGKYFNKYGSRIKHECSRFLSTVNPGVITRNDLYVNYRYDFFITTEIDYWTESIFYNLKKKNADLEVALMDEGYSSYTYFFREKFKPKYLKNKIKKIPLDISCLLGLRFSIANEAKKLYLFEPELNCWKENPYEILDINVKDSQEFVEKVNNIFGFNDNIKESIKEYEYPFIYFEESFFWMNRNSNDLEIISRISNIVGKSNLMIKLHPRNSINRFDGIGLKTNRTVGLPWELFAINMRDMQTTYITFSSGAVLNYKFLVSKSVRTILLYKCIGDEFYHVDDSLKEWFDKFKNKYPELLYIPETKDELYQYLEELSSKTRV